MSDGIEPETDREHLLAIYNGMKEVRAASQRMEMKLSEHGARIETLEGYRQWLTGAVAAVGALLGIHMGKHP